MSINKNCNIFDCDQCARNTFICLFACCAALNGFI